LVGDDAHATGARLDRLHGHGLANLGAGRFRQCDLRCDRRLDRKVSAVGLDDCDIVRWQPERPISPRQLGGCQHLVAQGMEMARRQRSPHQRAVRWTDLGNAGDGAAAAGTRLRLAPQLVGARSSGT
jgi:hypothetical protein